MRLMKTIKKWRYVVHSKDVRIRRLLDDDDDDDDDDDYFRPVGPPEGYKDVLS
jgi:hypothetical protein